MTAWMHAMCVEHVVRWCRCHGKLEIELHDGATVVAVGVGGGGGGCLLALPCVLWPAKRERIE